MDSSQFYDAIASHYDLIFEDWEASMVRQGHRIDKLIRTELAAMEPAQGIRVLDVSAGIGTQAIPLAQTGYRVTARDISAAAIRRLSKEATLRHVPITCEVADMRRPPIESRGVFDVVISFDNSLPHLLTDTALVSAFRACLEQLRAGGVFLGSVRDYSAVSRTPSSTHPYGQRIRDGKTYRLRQDWQWIDADHYDVTMVIEQQTADHWIETTRSSMQYYAVTLDQLLVLMSEAGFEQVRSDATNFYQPVLIGHRAV